MNFYVFAVYRNPGADASLLDCLLTAMSEVQQTDRKSSFVFVGDFNAHHREWLVSVSQTDAHGRALLDFATSSSCQQLVAGPTHSAGNSFDLVLTDVPGVVSVVVSPPVGRLDHSPLLLSLNVNQPVMHFTLEKGVYVKTGIIWANVAADVESLPWGDVFGHDQPVDRMNEYLLTILQRHARVKILRLEEQGQTLILTLMPCPI